MHSMSSLLPFFINRTACTACFCASFLLAFWSCVARTDTTYPTYDISMDMLYPAHYAARTDTITDAQRSDASIYHTIRISMSDLQSRQALNQRIQIASFAQFGSRKTGRLYNVSVNAGPLQIAQAIRLRSGSLRRYGVTLNEFIIPRGCEVIPIPERVLLIYAQLANTTLFQGLPDGYVLASPVLSVLVYDATNLSSTQPAQQIGVSTTSTPITIQFAATGDLKCASFDEKSTNVNYTDLVQGSCQVTHLGAFALVSSVSVPAPSPFTAPIAVLPRLPSSRSNTWKIVVGSVVGGFGLLVLVGLLALGIAKHRKKAKFAKMEYQTDHGETLQTTTIGNSRVPAAGGTRTQSMIEREYSV